MNDFDLVTAMGAMAIDNKLTTKELNFLGSCQAGLTKYGSLTHGMRRWAEKIAKRKDEPAPAERQAYDLPDLKGIYAIFTHALQHLKRPKITFQSDRLGAIRIAVAGKNSRYAGMLMVTDGGPFGYNKWFGHIDTEGKLIEGRNKLDDNQLEFLRAFSRDPVRYAKEYASESGACCYCNRPLTDERSTEVGYGPVCAKNYGLPWGAK